MGDHRPAPYMRRKKDSIGRSSIVDGRKMGYDSEKPSPGPCSLDSACEMSSSKRSECRRSENGGRRIRVQPTYYRSDVDSGVY